MNKNIFLLFVGMLLSKSIESMHKPRPMNLEIQKNIIKDNRERENSRRDLEIQRNIIKDNLQRFIKDHLQRFEETQRQRFEETQRQRFEETQRQRFEETQRREKMQEQVRHEKEFNRKCTHSLYQAVCQNNTNLAKKILYNNQVNLNLYCDKNKNTLLHYSVAHSNFELTTILLKKGAKCIENEYGLTPMDIADETWKSFNQLPESFLPESFIKINKIIELLYVVNAILVCTK